MGLYRRTVQKGVFPYFTGVFLLGVIVLLGVSKDDVLGLKLSKYFSLFFSFKNNYIFACKNPLKFFIIIVIFLVTFYILVNIIKLNTIQCTILFNFYI